MALDLSSMCRTCLETEKACMIPLFDKKPGKSSSVLEMFLSITSIKAGMKDGLPEKICLSCFTEINRAYSFKIKCEASEETLRQLLELNKTEEEEDEHEKQHELQPIFDDGLIKTEIRDKINFEREHSIQNKSESESENADNCSENILNSEYSYDNEELDTRVSIENKSVTEFILEVEEEQAEEDKEQEKEPEEEKESKKLVNSEEYFIKNRKVTVKRKNSESNLYSDDNSEISSPSKTSKVNEDSYECVKNETRNETENVTIKTKSKQPFVCQHCPADFVFLKNLNKHLEWHKKTFETQSHFKKNPQELISMHNEKLKKEIIFETATIGAHGEEILSPTTIDEIVEESAIQPGVKNIPEKYSVSCESCGACFQTERSLNYHRKLNRCMEKQFECLVCHKIFISKATLIEHIKIHTDNYQCSKCMKEFDLEEDYKSHMDNDHVTGKTIKNQCPLCKKCFTMLSALKDHMRVHSGEKPFICETCGRGFSQSTNLKQHTMRHSNTKPFKCGQCPCEFVSKGELNSHMRKHTGEHPFVCDTCGSGFTTSSSLKKHIRIHTGERPYACEFCPMRFAALGTLKNHRRTHTGEKPYLCRFCGRGFAQQSDRVTHERTHTGERPYVCTVCGSAFQQNGALKIHMKLHSDDRNSQNTQKKKKSNIENNSSSGTLTEVIQCEINK